MKISKITTGFVVQIWDTEFNKWVSQEFICGDDCTYETNRQNEGEVCDPIDLLPNPEPYLAYEMEQPE